MAGILAAGVAVAFFVIKPRLQSEDNSLPAKQAPPPPPPVDVAQLQVKIDQGDAAAMDELGEAYVEGRGVPMDYKKAAELFQKAAALGNVDAQATLGMLYDAGQGVPRNPELAVQWLQKAAEQNHVQAAYNLGAFYAQHENRQEATKWYLKAAQLGDSDAQYNMAQRYQLGVGVPIDLVEAYKWYELAVRNGSKDAAERRAKLKSQLSSQQLDQAMKRVAAWKPATAKP